jgi:hypothetical protein
MDAYNSQRNRSPNPEGRFTLFPGKADGPTTFLLTPECSASIASLARDATARSGKVISRSDVVGALHAMAQANVVDWIVQEVKRRDGQAANPAEVGPP